MKTFLITVSIQLASKSFMQTPQEFRITASSAATAVARAMRDARAAHPRKVISNWAIKVITL